MDTPIIVLEPTDSAIKLVVGYVIEKEPVILYAKTYPIKGIIKNGNIVDIKTLVEILRDVSHVEDKAARVKFDIKNCVLVIPNVGLEVYETKKSTNVVSNISKISKMDINNIISMMKKSRVNSGGALVDIVPITFYLDNGKINKLPIGMTSNYVGMRALVYTLPSRLIHAYHTALEASGIRVTRHVIGAYAIANLLAGKPNIPENYIYIDIGSNYTSMSLISKTSVFNSSYFIIGGNLLTNKIADAFNIDINEAEKIKRHYGLETRNLSFDPIIASGLNAEDIETKYRISDLKKVIYEYFDEYLYGYSKCLEKLLSAYPEDKRNFPIIFGGGGSRLEGLLKYFQELYPETAFSIIPLKNIGTRHQCYSNCIGALLATANYTGSLEDNSEISINANSKANIIKQDKKIKEILEEDED